MGTLNKTYNTYISYSGFTYRSPKVLKREIKMISARIEEVRCAINVRGLLMDMLVECAEREPQRWASEVKELSEEVAQSLKKLRELDGLLDGLLSEWRDVKCRAMM